ncbi:hypothetical protein MLD38_001341 [Melastoma candidum]|uniref:Uncharacterized protein n=1 Tax=Melastoma candidum TaxID=119954 RepID=A0ACB9SLK1_9MYRT|nr:hypothetical protein MLD38_001341 [Melastoma candidum]
MAGRVGWKRDFLYTEFLPFSAMVCMECINVGLNTLFKSATLHGMSYHVFVVYAYSIAALALLPSPFFSSRSSSLPPLTFSLVSRIALLGLIGSLSQTLGYTGIDFSSPTLASAISNLTPAFTFVLALLFRMEKVCLKRSSSQAKIIGTIVSISGAFVVTLYQGPSIIIFPKHSHSVEQHLNSSSSSWVIGGMFLTAEYILVPLWYIVQAYIMKEYPAEFTVVFYYNLTVSIIAAFVGIILEPNINAWKVSGIGLASVICSGVFGSCLNNSVHTWALRLKGPFYVAMFKPLHCHRRCHGRYIPWGHLASRKSHRGNGHLDRVQHCDVGQGKGRNGCRARRAGKCRLQLGAVGEEGPSIEKPQGK